MEIDYRAIGSRIRQKRKHLGLSQEVFAEKANISVQHISHIETANTKLSLPTLVNIANALGVTPDALLCDSVENSKNTYFEEITELLSSCSIDEVRIITEIIVAAVSAIHKKEPDNKSE